MQCMSHMLTSEARRSALGLGWGEYGRLERKGFPNKGLKMFGVQSVNISTNACIVC